MMAVWLQPWQTRDEALCDTAVCLCMALGWRRQSIARADQKPAARSAGTKRCLERPSPAVRACLPDMGTPQVWPIGMPLLLLMLLCATRSGSRKTLAKAMGPLSNEYVVGAYYWEVLEVCAGGP